MCFFVLPVQTKMFLKGFNYVEMFVTQDTLLTLRNNAYWLVEPIRAQHV